MLRLHRHANHFSPTCAMYSECRQSLSEEKFPGAFVDCRFLFLRQSFESVIICN